MEVSPPTPPPPPENRRPARKHEERRSPSTRGRCGPIGGFLGDCMKTGHDVDEGKRLLRGGRKANRKGTKPLQDGSGGEKDLCNKFTSLFRHEPNRRVGFNLKPQVTLIESKRERFPPTIRGVKMKREAFWTVWEVKQNRKRWNRHTEAHKEESTGFSCDCKECQAEGEDPDFIPFDRLGIHKMLQALSDGNVPPPAIRWDGKIRVPGSERDGKMRASGPERHGIILASGSGGAEKMRASGPERDGKIRVPGSERDGKMRASGPERGGIILASGSGRDGKMRAPGPERDGKLRASGSE